MRKLLLLALLAGCSPSPVVTPPVPAVQETKPAALDVAGYYADSVKQPKDVAEVFQLLDNPFTKEKHSALVGAEFWITGKALASEKEVVVLVIDNKERKIATVLLKKHLPCKFGDTVTVLATCKGIEERTREDGLVIKSLRFVE